MMAGGGVTINIMILKAGIPVDEVYIVRTQKRELRADTVIYTHSQMHMGI